MKVLLLCLIIYIIGHNKDPKFLSLSLGENPGKSPPKPKIG